MKLKVLHNEIQENDY